MPTIRQGEAKVTYYDFQPSELQDTDLPKCVRAFARDSATQVGLIASICVPIPYQGVGVGSNLLNQALSAMEKDCDRVWLTVDPREGVERRIRWYTRFGFRVLGQRKYRFCGSGESVTEVFMGLEFPF